MNPSSMIGIFVPENTYNDPDYDRDEFVDSMNDAKNATSSAAHFAALYAAHEIFMTDMPAIPIYHYNDSMLVSSHLTGWSRSVLGSIDFSTATIDRPSYEEDNLFIE